MEEISSAPRWGRQTALAIDNFRISGERVSPALVRALAMVKAEAATVNAELGMLPERLADPIRRAADEIVAGEMSDQFPIDIFQTGSGTSTNMNVNEVIANRATELAGEAVHPNDHVNASQSSNDTVPTAIRVAVALAITGELRPALADLADGLRELATRHEHTVKMARTHLMDAVPMTFGQEVGGWARALDLGAERLGSALARLRELPIGGTAVGTGLNAPPGFAVAVVSRIASRTGLDFVPAADRFEAQSGVDAFVETGAMLKVVALSLHKIAGDLRLLSSGPNGGLAEIELPELQAGSSIMPGKVNPVIPEVVQQVAAHVVGNDATIAFAAGSCATLQLTTALPVIARSLLSSVSLLANAARALADRCVRGITVNTERMRSYAAGSPALVTALAPRIGYDEAARLVKAGLDKDATNAADREAIESLDLLSLAHPGDAASRGAV
jgi:fumarate hydratase class II